VSCACSLARSRHLRSGFSLPMTTVRLRAAITGSLFPTCFFHASPNALQSAIPIQCRARSPLGLFPPPVQRGPALVSESPPSKAVLLLRRSPHSVRLLRIIASGPALPGRLALPQTSWNHLNSPPDWSFKSIRFYSLNEPYPRPARTGQPSIFERGAFRRPRFPIR
jgi:hypothetical protein